MLESRLRGRDNDQGVRAVDRTIALIEALGESDDAASLADLARAAHLTEATALRYLATLVRREIAERDSKTGRFRLGLRLLFLGERALGSLDPRRVARQHMENLRDRFGDTVNLGAFRDGHLVLVDVLEGTHSIKRGAQVGQEDSLHSTGLGKAVLAYLPKAERVKLLAQVGMKRYTSQTIIDFDALEAELVDVRARGYAVDHEETELGLSCVGVAVLDRRGYPAHALSVSGPTMRLRPSGIGEIAAELVQAASAVSHQLGYAPPAKVAAEPPRRTPGRKPARLATAPARAISR